MAEDPVPAHDIAEHENTYAAFLTGVVAAILAAAFALAALINFAFGESMSTVLGWATMLAGTAAITIDIRSGKRNWLFSLAALVVLGLITAVNVS